jgi:hypothetical protein
MFHGERLSFYGIETRQKKKKKRNEIKRFIGF